jgi:hypothetical protein
VATITASFDRIKTFGDVGHVVTWAALTTTNNYGSPVSMVGWSDRSIQLLGTLGAGGAVTMYGSNKAAPDEGTDTDWAILTDPQGNNIALTTLKVEQILEITRWVRPKITAGDGTTSLTVALLLCKSGSY